MAIFCRFFWLFSQKIVNYYFLIIFLIYFLIKFFKLCKIKYAKNQKSTFVHKRLHANVLFGAFKTCGGTYQSQSFFQRA